VLGHHLEQAYRCRLELGLDSGALAERAGRALALAGRAAAARGDAAATIALLARAIELLPADDAERGEVLIALGHAAHHAGEFRRVSEAAQELIALGRERGDARLECRGRLQAIWALSSTDPSVTAEEIRAAAEAAITILEDARDEAGLARAYQLLGVAHHFRARTNEHIDALEQALGYARNAGDTAHEAEIVGWLAVAYYFGPSSVDQAEARLEQFLAEARAKQLLSVEGIMLGFLGGIEGLRGRFDEARDLFRRSRATLADMGLQTWVAGQTQVTGHIEMLAGDYAAAEREFRFGSDELERMGETAFARSTWPCSRRRSTSRAATRRPSTTSKNPETRPPPTTSPLRWRGAGCRPGCSRGVEGWTRASAPRGRHWTSWSKKA
jgi:tetratricopeptide (TPR) repeat protein